ncbi:type II secretion system protein N [Vreelandella utahensis]|uniref:type II secretion system protein N n=1 Tax=Vreelandella halophila TaxID=86177 RepID=UPI0009841D61|nr:type II secretion system protein N [Halomonas utahensis]
MEKRINAMPVITAVTLAVTIAAVIGWQGVRVGDRISKTPQSAAGHNSTGDSTDGGKGEAPKLEELAFFGTPGEETTGSVERAETLPETNLQLMLRGVMAGDTENRDSALVEGPDGKTEVYRVGDALPGNASLREVRQRRIVIERAGALETLTFPESQGGRLALNGNQQSSTSNSSSDTADEAATDTSTPSERSSSDVRGRLEELRKRLSN